MIHTNNKIIKHKVGLLNLARELGNISKACQTMGLSRDTFYRYKPAVEEGGVEALLDKNRCKANIKNRVDPEIEQSVVDYALEQPAYGQTRASNELCKQGVFVSPSGVRSIWLRHHLESFQKRLMNLETKMAEESMILTEAQVQAFSILELAECVIKAIGSSSTVNFLPNQTSFVTDRVGCPEAAHRDLSFVASIGLEEGIRDFAQWRRPAEACEIAAC